MAFLLQYWKFVCVDCRNNLINKLRITGSPINASNSPNYYYYLLLQTNSECPILLRLKQENFFAISDRKYIIYTNTHNMTAHEPTERNNSPYTSDVKIGLHDIHNRILNSYDTDTDYSQ